MFQRHPQPKTDDGFAILGDGRTWELRKSISYGIQAVTATAGAVQTYAEHPACRLDRILGILVSRGEVPSLASLRALEETLSKASAPKLNAPAMEKLIAGLSPEDKRLLLISLDSYADFLSDDSLNLLDAYGLTETWQARSHLSSLTGVNDW